MKAHTTLSSSSHSPNQSRESSSTRPYKLFSIFHSVVFFYAFFSEICNCATQEGGYAITSPMVEGEKEAFYNVLEALNSELDWRSLYPDPCGGSSPQGAICGEWGGLWYLTSMSFGPVYDNTPPCGHGAHMHPSISKFTHLKSLSFFHCFTHTNTIIPSEISNLKASLQRLTFRNNGALVGEVPATIGELLNLERLVVTGNSLEGSIPMELGQLKLMVQLDLSNNKLSGVIPPSLGNLKELVVLDMSKNYLIGEVPGSMGGLGKLEKLDVSRNMLEGFMPDSMGYLKELKLLDLSVNRLQGSIPSSLGGFSSLQELYLSYNNFNGVLPINMWGSLTQLISLDLSNSNFEGPIPSSLASLESLRYLRLENNRLTGSIPSGIGRLSHLYLLDLNGNNLSGQLPFTPAFVERLGHNLLLFGNKELCSNLEAIVQSVNKNIRLCSSPQEAHQLSSMSTLLSHIGSNNALASRPSLDLLLTIFTFIFVVRSHS